MLFKSLQFKLMAVVLAIVIVSNVAMELISRAVATETVTSTVV